MTRKLITEFIGTFFLVLTIALAVMGEVEMAPLAIGSVLMVMVYMGGHVSGAHYNPAITLAVWLRGKLPAAEIVPYIAAQLAGAFVAALVAHAVLGGTFAPTPREAVSLPAFFGLEVLFTFALALVVLNVATAPTTAGNSYYGLAIGFTVLAGAFVAGPVSGGAFNPAVGFGPILVDALFGDGRALPYLWVYLVGPTAGALLAALVYKVMNPEEVPVAP